MTHEGRIDGMTFTVTGTEEGLTVTRVREHTIARYAPKILGVLHAAYTRRFVEGLGLLSQEAVDRQFAAKPNTQRQIERMGDYIAKGSAYWIARSSAYPSDNLVVGVAKTSPSRPRGWRGHFQPPNLYINDVASLAEQRGTGSALLYTASFDYDRDKLAVLDAVVSADHVNDWFEEIGFLAGATLTEPLEIGGEAMNQVRYESEVGVGGLRQALLARQPWLSDGLRHAATS